MRVSEIREIAQKWVEDQYAPRPNFVGAHLMGGINEMQPDDEFPTFSDVDIGVVIEGEGTRWPEDAHHQGLMLEIGTESADDYRSLETLIANPGLAPNLLSNSILVDPFHVLQEAHTFIAKEFARRRWVQARCDNERQNRIEAYIPAMNPDAIEPAMVFYAYYSVCTYLAGYIALANLDRPTHRKAFVRAQKIVEDNQAPHLHTALLELFGCADWDKGQVESCLQETADAFDLAVQIHKTPHLGDFKLKSHLRPYLVEASQDMIDQGFYREAVPWIATYYTIAAITIGLEGSESQKETFVNGQQAMMQHLGLSTTKDWTERRAQARQTADAIYAFCDDIIAAYPV